MIAVIVPNLYLLLFILIIGQVFARLQLIAGLFRDTKLFKMSLTTKDFPK